MKVYLPRIGFFIFFSLAGLGANAASSDEINQQILAKQKEWAKQQQELAELLKAQEEIYNEGAVYTSLQNISDYCEKDQPTEHEKSKNTLKDARERLTTKLQKSKALVSTAKGISFELKDDGASAAMKTGYAENAAKYKMALEGYLKSGYTKKLEEGIQTTQTKRGNAEAKIEKGYADHYLGYTAAKAYCKLNGKSGKCACARQTLPRYDASIEMLEKFVAKEKEFEAKAKEIAGTNTQLVALWDSQKNNGATAVAEDKSGAASQAAAPPAVTAQGENKADDKVAMADPQKLGGPAEDPQAEAAAPNDDPEPAAATLDASNTEDEVNVNPGVVETDNETTVADKDDVDSSVPPAASADGNNASTAQIKTPVEQVIDGAGKDLSDETPSPPKVVKEYISEETAYRRRPAAAKRKRPPDLTPGEIMQCALSNSCPTY